MKKGFIVITLFIIMISISLISNAATGSFSVSASSTSINVGSTTNINITAKDCGGKFAITSSDSNIVSVSESSKWIESGSQSIIVTGKKVGTATITITASNVADTSENEVSGSKTVKITVKDNSPSTGGNTQNPSTNEKATMTKVQVGNKTYTKSGFTVKVGNEVTSIKVVPTISNGESYTINGGTDNTVKLEEGTNTVNIKLASGNTYKIYIRRAAKVDDTPNIIDEEQKPKEEEKVFLKSLLIKGVISEEEKVELVYAPEFLPEIYEYSIVLDEETINVTKLDIEAIANKDDCTVEITGNEEIQDGENEIIITVKSKDGNTTAVYKILVIKEVEAQTTVAPTNEEPKQEENGFFTKDTLKIIIIAFTSGVAILGIIFAVIEYRYGRNKEEIDFKEDEIGESRFPGISLEKEESEEVEVPRYEEEPPIRKTKSRGKHF